MILHSYIQDYYELILISEPTLRRLLMIYERSYGHLGMNGNRFGGNFHHEFHFHCESNPQLLCHETTIKKNKKNNE